MKKSLVAALLIGLVGQSFAQTAQQATAEPQAAIREECRKCAEHDSQVIDLDNCLRKCAGFFSTGSLHSDAVGIAIIGVSAMAIALGSGNSGSKHGYTLTPAAVGGPASTSGTTGTH
jgi:hypothetical protein